MAARPSTLEQHQAHGSYSATLLTAEVKISGGREAEPVGSVALEICAACSFVTAQCEHSRNQWSEDGAALTCTLCGLDGT